MNFMKYFRTPFWRSGSEGLFYICIGSKSYNSKVLIKRRIFKINSWKALIFCKCESIFDIGESIRLIVDFEYKTSCILSVIYNNTSGDILSCILSAKLGNILCVLNPRSLTLWSASVWKASSNIYKGSRPEAIRVKDVFKNFTKFTREYLRRRHQTCHFINKETPTGVSYCEFLWNF